MISAQAPWQTLVRLELLEMLGEHIEFPEPDFRLRYLFDHFPCDQLTATEFGCWYGWHTVPLARKFKHVTAMDVRPGNVAKTLLRLNLLNVKNVDVVLANVEEVEFETDVLVHIGVLYHLFRPAAHLHQVLNKCQTICLDTHINKPDLQPVTEHYNGETYTGGLYKEYGWKDPLSGVGAHSLWLDEHVLRSVIAKHGFVVVHEERHVVPAGPRLNLVATRNIYV